LFANEKAFVVRTDEGDAPALAIDQVVRLERVINRFGFGGNLKIAQVLARAGYQLATRSLERLHQRWSEILVRSRAASGS
jgi:hypothetical protein